MSEKRNAELENFTGCHMKKVSIKTEYTFTVTNR